jgi:UDP-2,4-diacetamido-2,4,6-trideoxy-beta-L-altropyranose hydrolase
MVNERPSIVFRVDSGLSMGSGHLMRCLSLASALRELGLRSCFICRAHEGHLGALIEGQGHELRMLPVGQGGKATWLGADWPQDALQTLQAIGDEPVEWLVVDHYGIDARWESRIAGAARRQLVIDDLADRPHTAHLLLDQNLQTSRDRYAGRLPAGSRQLIGPRFALLRPEFARHRNTAIRRPRYSLLSILAFGGGVDTADLLSTTLAAWQALPPTGRPSLALVVGSHSPNLARLQDLCANLEGCTLHVQTKDMASLIAAADLMVTSGGTINWERCCLGVPALVCVTAANQCDNARELARTRTSISLGRAVDLDATTLARWLTAVFTRPSLLRRLGARAGKLVDGHGARRVAVAMMAHRLYLRHGVEADAEPSWVWRNAESTRRYSTRSESLELVDHLLWWRNSLADPNRALLVAELGGSPVGVLRLDHKASDAIVSIYIDPLLTGIGLGVGILHAGRAWIRLNLQAVTRLLAVILPENRASTAAFAAAGFRNEGNHWICELSKPE